jgi:hypothetical protein
MLPEGDSTYGLINKWAIKGADDQRHPIRIAVNDATMARGREGSRHGSLDRLHPLIELALLECDLAQARTRLEDLLLAGGLEILRNRPLELGLSCPFNSASHSAVRRMCTTGDW